MGEADAEGVVGEDRHTDAGKETGKAARPNARPGAVNQQTGEGRRTARGSGGKRERTRGGPDARAHGTTPQDAIPTLNTGSPARGQTREGQVPLGQGQGEARGPALPPTVEHFSP